jgi:PAS domain-containing protein
MHQALATGCAEDERWHVRKDGSRFYASGLMMTLRDTAGNLHGYVKVLRDMTAHQLAEDALRASEERLRLLIDSVQDYAILTLDQLVT